MYVIYDNRKNKYLFDIKRHLVSDTYEIMVVKSLKKAHQFKDVDMKQLRHFEDLLKYDHGDLEYVAMS